VQQPPPAQMSVYYYPSGQYPTSTTQQYRPLAPVQYSAQRGQPIPQAAQAGTCSLLSMSSSKPVIFACQYLSCPLWMSIQAWQFKSPHFLYLDKITEHWINSVWKSNRYKKVKPMSLQHPDMHAKYSLHKLFLDLLNFF